MRGFPLVLCSWLACAASACSVYDTSLLKDRVSVGGSTNTGGTSGGGATPGGGTSGGGSSGAATCSHVTFPLASTGVTPSEKSLETVAVMYDIDLGDGDPILDPRRYLNVGFDLDKVCTPKGSAVRGECLLPSYALPQEDGPNGEDNALGANIQFIRGRIDNFSSEIYTAGLKNGTSANVVVHITGYNGEPDDDAVRVETMVAAPFDALTHDGRKPRWDGTDDWPIASDSVIAGNRDRPKFVDDHAYVTHGKIVVSLPEASLRLITSLTNLGREINLKVVMRAASVVCDVVPTAADQNAHYLYTIENCTVAARWKVDDIVKQLSQFTDPSTGDNSRVLCTNSPAYSLFKRSLCQATDTYSAIPGPNTVCDSLSMGVRFNAKPGLLGPVFTVQEPTLNCPAATEPSNDSCDSLLPDGTGGAGGGGAGSGGAGGTPDAGQDGGGGLKDASSD